MREGELYFFTLVINVYAECGIFLLESVQSAREVGALFPNRFQRERNDWIWNEHGSLIERHLSATSPIFNQ